ncbi:MAG: carbohydrate kinase family protein, partial [Chloroflexi bacterium]|nr:carbohydrate kinase family protein [Chloroflexota bacterium]
MTRGPAGLHFGHLNIDQVLHLDAWPAPGREVLVAREARAVGGSAANTAIVVA